MAQDRSPSQPAPFLRKTYDMVDDSSTNSVISWSEGGTRYGRLGTWLGRGGWGTPGRRTPDSRYSRWGPDTPCRFAGPSPHPYEMDFRPGRRPNVASSLIDGSWRPDQSLRIVGKPTFSVPFGYCFFS